VPGTGQTTPPTDPDTDGLYEDVDGDGSVAFDDVITLAFADFASVNADADQRAAVDFDGDGSFTFGDVIQLAFQL
jgi:PKD repeat protein